MRIQFENWREIQTLAYSIRHQVFVMEQNVPIDMEIDAFDPIAMHIILSIHQRPVGTARIFKEVWENQTYFRIGRLALLKDYRGKGYGKAIMIELENYAQKNGKFPLLLHAQLDSIGFYEKLGFLPTGEIFDEAGIKHKTCYKIL